VTGAELRALREGAGMTREDLAARLGVSAQSVWRWEKSAKVREVLLPALREVLVGV
jgi:transcriptional regulator with XRE-family HTH domain